MHFSGLCNALAASHEPDASWQHSSPAGQFTASCCIMAIPRHILPSAGLHTGTQAQSHILLLPKLPKTLYPGSPHTPGGGAAVLLPPATAGFLPSSSCCLHLARPWPVPDCCTVPESSFHIISNNVSNPPSTPHIISLTLFYTS